jgi:hypothetical protein
MNPDSNAFEVNLECKSLHGLFNQSQQLSIPDYQRSYSWKSSHVLDLLKDTFGRFERTTPYLMGTVILHGTKQTLDIVDGQQRLVTLTVLLHELGAPPDSLPLLKGKFNADSAKVIRNARKTIREFLKGNADEKKAAFRERLLAQGQACLQFMVLILSGENALDRAYTFFDSVNSKGKPLRDFDLLKANHLMFIPPEQEALASNHNDEWLRRDESHAHLFSTILRRIRMWSREQDRDSKRERPDYNEFCAEVEPEDLTDAEHKFNRYMQPVTFRSWRRMGDKIVLSMDYPVLDGEALIPTQITQTIEGGDAFFLYAKRYHELYETLFKNDSDRLSTAVSFVRNLAEHIDNQYLQNAFRAVMLLYVDKFGEERLIEVGVSVERIISAWRWKAGSLRIEGTLTHVRGKRLVPILLESVNVWHVYSQLLVIAQSQSSPPADLRGVQLRYRESMTRFYTRERSKILEPRVHALASSYCANDKQDISA